MFKKFTSQDLLYIAIFSALGLAVKPIVTPLIHLISAPLMIPGGSLAGGFYMMWIALAIAVVNKPGTGILIGIVQAIVMISLGYFGNHGAVSLISYTLPGITAEIVAHIFKEKSSITAQTAICTFANISGALVVTLLVMRLATIPLLISLVAAAISGIVGGMLSYSLFKKLRKYRIV
ncbi:MAG: ECF transporter S component [Candidatus Cloacimonetes bacterium]|nr:ECF transporter S component [Candidatus Cloacimonadota bacterium]MCF7814842.1 ECF transporter S component [Candidatus Cloacimonadota bacterium]MCF7867898.1 ECF transporter S component [Candidatus Cloacimonadota bacterium]MCF7883717.1 ECF transporter S component [Candidatus Cloacimonadota bacterium]